MAMHAHFSSPRAGVKGRLACMTPAALASLRKLVATRRAAGVPERLAEALERLAVALSDPREEAAVLAELGRVRLSQSDAEQAFLALARALWLTPDDASILSGLAGPVAQDVLRELRVDAPARALPHIDAALARLG
jgi:cytochrome c-type biogenesis protein CcmH/NrfG